MFLTLPARQTRSAQPEAVARWEQIHRQGMSIATRKARLDHEEAEWMLTAEQSGVHRQLGYGSFCQYLEFVFGYSTQDALTRLRVAKRLAELPEVSAALRRGQQTWSGCRELSRVATAETETEWLAATADKNVRQIERLVSGLEKGDLPDDNKKLSAATHRLSFEVDSDSFALWREAVKKLRAEHGGSLTDDEVVSAMARRVLEGPTDEGRASYQIALTVCETCEQAFQQGSGEACRRPRRA
jgi:hypothetical protein